MVRHLAYFNYRSYVNRMGFCGDEKVLEVGCGGGNLSRVLAGRVGKLVCVDCSKYWIRKVQRRLGNFKNVEFGLVDVLDFKKENYFDAVVVSYVLHDIAEKNKVVGILRRCLKDGGIVYVREPMRKSHGISADEIRKLFLGNRFAEENFWEGYSFPLRGRVCEFVFRKKLF